MGEQIAIESYLRGMVKQFDDTKCKMKGCDQGFHNYMYYSGGLKNVQGVRDVIVFGQGKGIINNLGVLRSKPLKEWGLLDEGMKVLNWDKSISPVAHQFDRDGDLNNHLKGIRSGFEKEFKSGTLTKSLPSEKKHSSNAWNVFCMTQYRTKNMNVFFCSNRDNHVTLPPLTET